MIDLTHKTLFLFDLDGVLYIGRERPEKIGGTKVFKHIKKKGKKLFILTNNSTDTTEKIHSNLKNLGLEVGIDDILTCSKLTAEYVRKKYGQVTYYLIGEKGLDEELRRAGLRRTFGSRADVLIVGLDRKLTYDKLDRAVQVVRNGADMVATHKARLYMDKQGPKIAVGPIVKAIEYASGKRAISIGKPSPLMFQLAMDNAKCSAKETVMIGDQVETDVAGAKRMGIDPILVLTGVDKMGSRIKAVTTVKNVDDLADYI